MCGKAWRFSFSTAFLNQSKSFGLDRLLSFRIYPILANGCPYMVSDILDSRSPTSFQIRTQLHPGEKSYGMAD